MAAAISLLGEPIVSPGRHTCQPRWARLDPMKISMHAMSVGLFSNTLGNLSGILDKGFANATSRKFDPGVLLASRLAPDMLPLTRQVQIACDIAKNSVARLAG